MKINLDDVWPQERDVISSPHRLKYLRKVVKPGDDVCVFCEVLKRGVSFESLCVYQTDKSMVVLNKYPYNSGHVLVLPQRHIGDLTELSEDEYTDLNKLLRQTVVAVKKIYKSAGLNVGLNQGQAAGAGIPGHLHWHVIPRWNGDTNFFPLIAETKLIPEDLKQTYDNFKSYFDKI